jgi:hypothetical protein
MDRRAKKIEKARKRRELVKKRERSLAMKEARDGGSLLRSAARAPFGPCWLSAGWDDERTPELVTALVTRRLGDGRLLPAVALVDRTCLGVKNGFFEEPLAASELDDFTARLFAAHGDGVQIDPFTVQSVVFHAIDYAHRLGFEPHADFPAALFGPRPDALLSTPWHAAERPVYVSGPRDDARAVLRRLAAAVGEQGFDFIDSAALAEFEDEDEDGDFEDGDFEDEEDDDTDSLQPR